MTTYFRRLMKGITAVLVLLVLAACGKARRMMQIRQLIPQQMIKQQKVWLMENYKMLS